MNRLPLLRLCAGGLALLLAAAAARADLLPLRGQGAADAACPVTTAAAPRAATLAGCQRAWCTALGGERWCVCRRTDAQGDDQHSYLRIPAGGAAVPLGPAEVSPMLGAEAFTLLQADLDGDGRAEHLVVQRQAVSNGMGVEHATLCTWPVAGGPPQCREVQDWGALSGLVREPGRAGCSLLDAGWEPGEEPGRGHGTYALGRLVRWAAAGWQPVPLAERPMLARRLTRSFERERPRLHVQPKSPLWTQHPDTRAVRCRRDLLCEAERAQ